MSKFYRSPNDNFSSSSSSGSSPKSKDTKKTEDQENIDFAASNFGLADLANFPKLPLQSINVSDAKLYNAPNALVPIINDFKSSPNNSTDSSPARNVVKTGDVLPLLALDLLVSHMPIESQKEYKSVLVDLMRHSGFLSPHYHTPLFQLYLNYLGRKVFGAWVNFAKNLPLVVDDRTALTDQLKQPMNYLSLDMPINFEKQASRYQDDFEEVKPIGMGGFGRVFHCKSRLDKQNYAIKRFYNSQLQMLNECRFHARFQHPNVVRYHNAWLEYDTYPVNGSSEKLKRLSTTTSRPFTNSNVVFLHDNSLKAPSLSSASIQFEMTASSRECSDENAHCIISTPRISKKSLSSRDITDFDTDFDSDKDNFDEEDDDESAETFDSTGSLDSSNARRRGRQLAKLPIIDNQPPQFVNILANDIRLKSDTLIIVQYPVLYIQMELCNRTLDHYLVNLMDSGPDVSIDTDFNEKVVDSLLSAVAFLHKKEVIHRDIKPSNVFIKSQDGHDTILLGDFGLARNIQELALLESSISNTNLSLPSSKMTSGLGTTLYAAPEQLSSNCYTLSVDIYSTGVVVYEMYHKFSTKMERINTLKTLRSKSAPSNDFIKQWPKLAPIIHSMISKSPDQRPSANELLSKFKISRAQDSEADMLRAEIGELKKQLAQSKLKIEQLEQILNTHTCGGFVDQVIN